MGLRPAEANSEDQGVTDVADSVLVARAQLDRAAFAPIYDRYFDPVFRFCFYRVGDWQEAEDAASDVFASVLANLGKYRPGERDDSFRSWLFTIARNTVINRHRLRARHQNLSLATASEIRDQSPSPEEAALTSDNHRILFELMEQLDPSQRELLELRLAGLSDADIASVLNRSHDAVRKQQSRTIKSMRSIIASRAETEASHA